MTKITKILFALIASLFVFASCMKDDETASAPECAILSFSVGDIKSYVTVHRSSGSDTTITRTVSGSSIKFNIDQVNGIITTVDSVTNWLNLTKVVPTFTCYGYVYGQTCKDTIHYQWTSGSDSINFEKPVDIIVLATDGVSTKHYKASIKRSAYASDTITWAKISNDCKVTENVKTLELSNYVYAFFKNSEGKVQVTTAQESKGLSSWTTPLNVEGTEIDYASTLIYKDNFYALGSDGHVYKINKEATSYTAEKASDKVFTNLLASDSYYIYATDGKSIIASQDFKTWSTCGTEDINMLPTSCCSSYSYTSKTNDSIQICMMNGLSDNNSSNAVAWYKVTSMKSDVNQNWMYIQITKDNIYSLPKFKHMTTAKINGSMYATGIESDGKYKYIYESDDNGITWHKKDIYPLPVDFSADNGHASMVGADGKLWIIQKGNIWSGVIK